MHVCSKHNLTPYLWSSRVLLRLRVFPASLNWLWSHGKNQLDANLLRRFPVTEKKALEFQLDMINAFNDVFWDVPYTTIDSSNFGRVTTQWNTPRFIQFQLRFTF
jgi:hypothetical protein